MDENPKILTDPEQEFRAIYRKHYPWLVNWLYMRVDSRDDAEDLAQDIFLVLYRKLPGLKDRGHLHPYIYGIATKVLMAHGRKNRKQQNVKTSITPEDIADEEETNSNEEAAALRNAIRSLPKKLELVVDTYYSRELTYEETADILGLTRSKVQSRLRKALKILKSKMEKSTVV
jgi:RNA polymerase sigma-70 factor (ECF subfamily)